MFFLLEWAELSLTRSNVTTWRTDLAIAPVMPKSKNVMFMEKVNFKRHIPNNVKICKM